MCSVGQTMFWERRAESPPGIGEAKAEDALDESPSHIVVIRQGGASHAERVTIGTPRKGAVLLVSIAKVFFEQDAPNMAFVRRYNLVGETWIFAEGHVDVARLGQLLR
ncbi:MAG: hypothetical protein M1816_000429 [Peltula sp. TS41687]|nr:MAG: hypothetical protein M1816_000429 [Peltula sp. TS41687]